MTWQQILIFSGNVISSLWRPIKTIVLTENIGINAWVWGKCATIAPWSHSNHFWAASVEIDQWSPRVSLKDATMSCFSHESLWLLHNSNLAGIFLTRHTGAYARSWPWASVGRLAIAYRLISDSHLLNIVLLIQCKNERKLCFSTFCSMNGLEPSDAKVPQPEAISCSVKPLTI